MSQKPRIAILGIKYFPSKGGTSRVVEDMLTELRDQYEFTIYCYKDEAAEGHLEGVNVVQFSPYPFGPIGVFFYFLRCTLHMLRHGKYDMIHVHKMDAAFFLPMLLRRFTVIATCHAVPYKTDKWNAIARFYFRSMEKMFIRSKAKLTAISRPLSEYFKEQYGREVLYIPNGVEISEDFDYDAADNILAEHQVEGEYLFFAARRIMGIKGPHHMLRALNKINYQGTVVIAGDLSQMPAFTKKIKELAEPLNVKFIGYVNGKAKLMALVDRAKFFLFPSEIEGMSIMLLEVGSVGTPLICSDIAANTAVFGDPEVLYFRSQDSDDFAEKLSWAFEHEEEMAEKARNARSRVEEEYAREVVVQNYIELYDSMLPTVLN
ncbi:MAG: glycosyltransferase family 4 protein [Bacteroidota bacterium]